MRRSKMERLITLLLSVMLVVGCVPMGAIAASASVSDYVNVSFDKGNAIIRHDLTVVVKVDGSEVARQTYVDAISWVDSYVWFSVKNGDKYAIDSYSDTDCVYTKGTGYITTAKDSATLTVNLLSKHTVTVNCVYTDNSQDNGFIEHKTSWSTVALYGKEYKLGDFKQKNYSYSITSRSGDNSGSAAISYDISTKYMLNGIMGNTDQSFTVSYVPDNTRKAGETYDSYDLHLNAYVASTLGDGHIGSVYTGKDIVVYGYEVTNGNSLDNAAFADKDKTFIVENHSLNTKIREDYSIPYYIEYNGKWYDYEKVIVGKEGFDWAVGSVWYNTEEQSWYYRYEWTEPIINVDHDETVLLPHTAEAEGRLNLYYGDHKRHDYELIEHVDASCVASGHDTYKCKYCDKSYTDTIAALGHDMDAGVVTTPATCTAAGVKTYTCQREGCAYATTEKIPATGHTPGSTVTENVVAPSCSATGSHDEVVYCTVCKAQISRTTVIDPMLPHSFGDWADDENGTSHSRECSVCYTTECENHKWGDPVVVEATETAAGSKTWTCSVCDAVREEVIPATGHSYTSEETTAPTCTEKGVMTYTCVAEGHENCDAHTYTEEIPALGHDMDEGAVTTAATCTADGVKTFTCQREGCNYTATEKIPATGHTPGETVIENEIAPDCEHAGSHDEVVYCTVCTAELSRESKVDDALGHIWDEGQVTTEPKCGVPGETTYHCERNGCEATMTEPIDALTHDWQVAEAAVEPKCEIPGKTALEECSHCHETRGGDYIEALTHQWGEWIETKAASCTEKGEETSTCGLCGKVLTREIEMLPHKYAEEITTPATCEEDGVKTFTCSCGESYTESILAIGHDWDAESVTFKWTKVEGENGTAYICSATFICKNNAEHTITVDCAVVSDYDEENGETKFTATAVVPGTEETVEDSKTVYDVTYPEVTEEEPGETVIKGEEGKTVTVIPGEGATWTPTSGWDEIEGTNNYIKTIGGPVDMTLEDDPAREGYVFNGWAASEDDDENIILTAQWLEDVIGGLGVGDGIPDKYQKTVTFKVENGKWNDGSVEDKTVCVTLRNAEGKMAEDGSATLTDDQIPAAGDMPADGYKTGSWETDPAVEITEEKTFTYAYAPYGTNAITYNELADENQDGEPDGEPVSRTENVRADKNVTVDPGEGTWDSTGWTDNGDGSYTRPASEDFTVADPVAPEGKIFAGWVKTETEDGITLTAKYVDEPEEEYTYGIYYANGSDINAEPIPDDENANATGVSASFTLDENTFTRTGYHFTGWATEDGGAPKYQPGDTLRMTYTEAAGLVLSSIEDEPITLILYAAWEQDNIRTEDTDDTEPEETPEKPEEPVEIEETGTPLSELPEITEEPVEIEEPGTPLAALPEEFEDLPEDDVPLASVPTTGEKARVWVALSLALSSFICLLVLLRKKED